MTTLMRLSQYCYMRAESTKGVKKKLYMYMRSFFVRQNLMLHNFEYGANPQIENGVIFHHTDVCITSKTYIESGVHNTVVLLLERKMVNLHILKKVQKLEVILLS